MAPKIMCQILQLKENKNYCSRFPFKTRNINSTIYGTETISFLGPKIWMLIPKEIRKASTLEVFKQQIKLWKIKNCPCRLCKRYIARVGFI